jgi:PIN domain nuclease of toxin-antitoxin system
VNLLLDTQVWLWWVSGGELADEAQTAIGDPMVGAVVSAASVWEVSIKRALGQVELDVPLITA